MDPAAGLFSFLRAYRLNSAFTGSRKDSATNANRHGFL
jgi:hypothetical protein